MENMINHINHLYAIMHSYCQSFYLAKTRGQKALESSLSNKIVELCERIENLINFYNLYEHFNISPF